MPTHPSTDNTTRNVESDEFQTMQPLNYKSILLNARGISMQKKEFEETSWNKATKDAFVV